MDGLLCLAALLVTIWAELGALPPLARAFSQVWTSVLATSWSVCVESPALSPASSPVRSGFRPA